MPIQNFALRHSWPPSAKRARADCLHPATYQCKCLLCNEFMGDNYGIAFEYLLPTLRITEVHARFISSMNTINMVKSGKLHLVLDLDHTLIHTVRLDEKEELEVAREEILARRDLFLIEDEYLTKLRPFLREFLMELSALFEMTVYTMGGRVYGNIMAGLIDPEGSYFSDRVITREDCTAKGCKSLDIVLAEESHVLIVDDKREVWPGHMPNLIAIEPYHYFTTGGMKSEEEDDDRALLDILETLKAIHWAYFSPEFAIQGIEDTSCAQRPFVWEFLREANTMFEMTIYTTGSRYYGQKIADLIDPKGVYLGNRVITRENCTLHGRRSLDIAPASESDNVIINVRAKVWPDHARNLILIEPYYYFLTKKGKGKEDDRWVLRIILKRLRRIHHCYFWAKLWFGGNQDVRDLLEYVMN